MKTLNHKILTLIFIFLTFSASKEGHEIGQSATKDAEEEGWRWRWWQSQEEEVVQGKGAR